MYSDGEDNPRIFSPNQQIRGNPSKTISQPSDILHHDVDSGTRKLIMYALAVPDVPRVVKNSLVVAIDGACRNNGPDATASYGIFFAPGSPLNTNGGLPASNDLPANKDQKAELHALAKALDIVEAKFGDGRVVSRVIIITTSMYLVDGLAREIWEWEYKGYVDSKGKDVLNGEVFKELHKRIGRLENGGVDVCFWVVERRWNGEAEGMANEALDTPGL